MDKQEIQDIREKISAQEPTQIQRAIGFVGFSYGLMAAGITFWFLLFISGTIYSRDDTLVLSIIGSTLLHPLHLLTARLHNKHLPIHWFLQGFMRTIIQFYYFGSILLLFIITQYVSPRIGGEFLFLYLLLFLPIYVGYMLPRWEKIKNLFQTNFFEDPSG